MPTKRNKTSLHSKAHLLVVPHKKNQYRPHLLRTRGLAILFIGVFGLLFVSVMQQKSSVLGSTMTVSQEQLLKDTNSQRLKAGSSALKLNQHLISAAAMKASDMFNNQYWAHVSPSGVTPWIWMKKGGYNYGYAGENLARGYQTAGAVVTAWMNSPEHRENLLSKNYVDVGFAVGKGKLNGETTTLVVAMYGAPHATNVLASTLLAPDSHQLGLLETIGVAMQSMNATALGALVLLIIGIVLSLVAHSYRSKLPKDWRNSWKRHHGIYKAIAMSAFAVLVIVIYGSGQL